MIGKSESISISGQSIEETTNRFAHKKGSIASRINAEVAAKKNSSNSPEKKRKKGSTLSNISISKASSDSGVGRDIFLLSINH